MTTLVQVLKTLRTRLAAAGLLAAGAALVAAAQDASGTGATLVDCSTSDLQTAIDNAPPGATLAVSGMCLGSYTIGKNLTLVGRGPAVLDGQQAGTVLTISAGATVGLSQMTITDGNGNGTGFAGDGGGIENSGTLTVSESAVSNSAASNGGGIFNDSNAALTLNQTTVSGNSGTVFGGGIYNNGMMTLNQSSVSENSATYGGGGIFSCCGFSPVTLIQSTISDNAATTGSGGGIFNLLDDETLSHTTVSGNTASLEGGGINNNAGTTTLNYSVVTNNTALLGESGSYGGGIFDFSGVVPLYKSTVSGNNPDNCDPAGNVSDCTG
jgi:hypothetical protein